MRDFPPVFNPLTQKDVPWHQAAKACYFKGLLPVRAISIGSAARAATRPAICLPSGRNPAVMICPHA
jgi:hypothetical protein